MRIKVAWWVRCWLAMVATVAVCSTGAGQVTPPNPTNAASPQLILPKAGETLPTFEVATIRASAESNSMTIGWMPDGYKALNMELRSIIRMAYGATSDDQIVGGPDALMSRHFDINGKVDADLAASFKKMSREDRNREMALTVQSMLAERFHLKVHTESKEMPVYALVLAKGGSKLKESAPPPPPPADGEGSAQPGQPPSPPSPDQPLPKQPPPGSMMMRGSSTKMELTASAGTMEGLAKILANQPDAGGRQVIDRTGLTGKYDYHLEWAPAGAGMAMKGADNGTASADQDLPGLFTAVEEQLGLKLEPGRGQVQTVVIDHVEAPTAN